MKNGYIISILLAGASVLGSGSFSISASPTPQGYISVGVPIGSNGNAGLYLDDSGVVMQMNLTPSQRNQYYRIRDKHYKKWAKQARKEARYREKARREYLKELRRYLAPTQYVIFNDWAIGPGIGHDPVHHHKHQPKHKVKKVKSGPKHNSHFGPMVPAPAPKKMYSQPPQSKDYKHKDKKHGDHKNKKHDGHKNKDKHNKKHKH